MATQIVRSTTPDADAAWMREHGGLCDAALADLEKYGPYSWYQADAPSDIRDGVEYVQCQHGGGHYHRVPILDERKQVCDQCCCESDDGHICAR